MLESRLLCKNLSQAPARPANRSRQNKMPILKKRRVFYVPTIEAVRARVMITVVAVLCLPPLRAALVHDLVPRRVRRPAPAATCTPPR